MNMHTHPVAVALVCAACASAAAGATEYGDRALAAGCASCHQPALQAPPPLGGQPFGELVSKMREFRNGTRSGTVMPQLAKGYTEAQTEAIARYFSTQPAPR
jgi:sulfide dehydrogenase cytochrome subunit